MMAVLALAACEGRAPAEPELPAMEPLPSAVPLHGRLGALVRFTGCPGPTPIYPNRKVRITFKGEQVCPDNRRGPPDLGGWYSNVYDIMRPRMDSLAREHPASYCTTLQADAEERVDCLRLPVQVGNQTVWTDSSGYFTAPGPYRPVDTLKVWVDRTRLPRWHEAPGGRSNCAVDSEINWRTWPFRSVSGAHICFPASFLNMDTGYRRYTHDPDWHYRSDTMYVVVPAEPDTVPIHAQWDQTWMLRLAKPDMKVRVWSLVSVPFNRHHQHYWFLHWEGRTDWNGEVILKRSLHANRRTNPVEAVPNPWEPNAMYLQVDHPTEGWEACVPLRLSEQPPDSMFGQLGFDWSNRVWSRRHWDCADGMDKRYERGTIHRCAPPVLDDPLLRGQSDGPTLRCDRFFGH